MEHGLKRVNVYSESYDIATVRILLHGDPSLDENGYYLKWLLPENGYY